MEIKIWIWILKSYQLIKTDEREKNDEKFLEFFFEQFEKEELKLKI